MSANHKTLLCRYHYDPLDRLADCTPSAQAHTQRFYLKERLTSEIQGSVQRSIFQQGDQLLAQQQRQDGVIESTLLATDQQRSVLHALDATQPHPLAYTPYGHRPAENGLLSLLGFNGERPDPVTGHYLLGNGYRAFNPVLMRFNSPDSLSPFGDGGVNAYTYCVGDPVNRVDPTGHLPAWFKSIGRALGFIQPSSRVARADRAYNLAVQETAGQGISGFPTNGVPNRPLTPPPSPIASKSPNDLTAAWTTRETIAVHHSPSASRRGSHSYYLDGGETSDIPFASGPPSPELSRPRASSQHSWWDPFTARRARRAAEGHRPAVVMDDNDPGLTALRHRFGVVPPGYDDTPPPPYDAPPSYEEVSRNRVRRT